MRNILFYPVPKLCSPVVTAWQPDVAASVGGHSGKPCEFLQTDAFILKATYCCRFILFVLKRDFDGYVPFKKKGKKSRHRYKPTCCHCSNFVSHSSKMMGHLAVSEVTLRCLSRPNPMKPCHASCSELLLELFLPTKKRKAHIPRNTVLFK